MTRGIVHPLAVDARAMARHWQRRLGLLHWWLAVSDVPADEDHRSSVEMFIPVHRAVIKLDAQLPVSQLERQVVHELLHVRLADMDDALHQVTSGGDVVRTWYGRAQETAIEALVSALLPDATWEHYSGPLAGVAGLGDATI